MQICGPNAPEPDRGWAARQTMASGSPSPLGVVAMTGGLAAWGAAKAGAATKITTKNVSAVVSRRMAKIPCNYHKHSTPSRVCHQDRRKSRQKSGRTGRGNRLWCRQQRQKKPRGNFPMKIQYLAATALALSFGVT